PFLVLPFSLGEWNLAGGQFPVLAVLWLLLGMVGLPFFVVATSAPLLQRWFATTGHPAAKDPYFLYRASNLGSRLALVSYPILAEPYFTLQTQTILWAVGYGILAALVIGCGIIVWKHSADVQFVPAPEVTNVPAPSPPTAVRAEPSTAIS